MTPSPEDDATEEREPHPDQLSLPFAPPSETYRRRHLNRDTFRFDDFERLRPRVRRYPKASHLPPDAESFSYSDFYDLRPKSTPKASPPAAAQKRSRGVSLEDLDRIERETNAKFNKPTTSEARGEGCLMCIAFLTIFWFAHFVVSNLSCHGGGVSRATPWLD